MADLHDIAKELTLSIVQKIDTTEGSTQEAYNLALAAEIGNAYVKIYDTINVTKKNNQVTTETCI